MKPGTRIIILIMIMVVLVSVSLIISFGILYQTAIQQEKTRLLETARSQARLIEAIAHFYNRNNIECSFGIKTATLMQIREAHSRYKGFGMTGEFTLAERKDNQIIFLLSHRHYDLDNLKPVDWDSDLAAPMRAALSGKSGVLIGLDYRGEKVLAAYEPVDILNFGIVAKIDISEVRKPFIRAGFITGIIATFLIIAGVSVFFKLTNPLLYKLNKTIEQLQKALKEVKALRGILPICTYCKKIRDDAGYWNQVDIYIKEHSSVDFSHGICPSCMEKHFPGFHAKENK